MTIKIKAEKIGIKKPIEVKPTLAKQTMANKMLIKLLSLSKDSLEEELKLDVKSKSEIKSESEIELTDEEKSEKEKELSKKAKQADLEEQQNYIKSLEDEDNFVQEAFDFLGEVLKLNEKQVQNAKDSLESFEDLGAYVSYVIGRIKGRSDADYDLDEKIEEAKQTDPKEN